jgi:hypothetical protein
MKNYGAVYARILLFLIIYSSLVLVRIFGLVSTFGLIYVSCLCSLVTRISHMSKLGLTLNINWYYAIYDYSNILQNIEYFDFYQT